MFCFHRNLSRPWKDCSGHYKVCLLCGREFRYSWSEMRIERKPWWRRMLRREVAA